MVALASVAAVLAPRARDVRAPGPRTARVVCCSAQPAASRRAVLAAPALLLAASSLPARALNAQGEYEITELPKPYQAAQVAEYRKLLLSTMKEKAVSLDYRKLVRLLFNDAAGGGRDGSVHFSEEMSRPENAGLADTVKALAAVRRYAARALAAGPLAPCADFRTDQGHRGPGQQDAVPAVLDGPDWLGCAGMQSLSTPPPAALTASFWTGVHSRGIPRGVASRHQQGANPAGPGQRLSGATPRLREH